MREKFTTIKRNQNKEERKHDDVQKERERGVWQPDGQPQESCSVFYIHSHPIGKEKVER